MKKLKFLLLALLFCIALTACGEEKDVMEEIYSAPIVKVESAETGAVIFANNDVTVTKQLSGLNIQPSDENFNGEWLYRFTYNPSEKVKGADEIVVLFGQEDLQIDGATYVADPGVPYSRILDWAELAYSYCAENYADRAL